MSSTFTDIFFSPSPSSISSSIITNVFYIWICIWSFLGSIFHMW
jgi:hypothetical protein